MHRFITRIEEDDHTGELFVKLPESLLSAADLNVGDVVEYSVEHETITLTKTDE